MPKDRYRERLAQGRIHLSDLEAVLRADLGDQADVPGHATAFGGRGAGWLVAASAAWDDPAEDVERHGWAELLHEAAEADSTGIGYANMLADDRPAYSSWTRARLRAIKAEWDSENVFRANHNIAPLV